MFTLKEAQEAIKNKPEFSCNEREFGFVIDYNLTMDNTFVGETERQTLILKNLRGTCFDASGKIISLALDKFHNMNECDGWRESEIDFAQPHMILQKLDGSMLRPIPVGTDYRLGTRAGITDVALMAERFVQGSKLRDAYEKFFRDCVHNEITPCFEYCSRENRVVIDYPESKLVLLCMRENKTGEYVTYYTMKQLAFDYGIPVVQPLFKSEMNSAQLKNAVEDLENEEGVVVTFDNGFRVKLKNSVYVTMHRAIDNTRLEKNVLALIVQNQLDDVLPLLTDDARERVIAYRDSVLHNIQRVNAEIDAEYRAIAHLTAKKDYAMVAAKSVYKTWLFNKFDGKVYSIADFILSKCGSQSNVDSIRHIVGKAYSEFV